MPVHTLYSYRRCPYAMRVRMALVVAGIQCEVHEIDFKNKPHTMLTASPKGTVPVLILNNGDVIDESFDVVLWALQQNDPEKWLVVKGTGGLIAENDGAFKQALDRYKYPNRFPDEDCSDARDKGEEFLHKLNGLIEKNGYLLSDKRTLADICIFPFIRQFANVDRKWFDVLDFKPLQSWLKINIENDLFAHIMKKHKKSSYQLF